MPRNTRTEDTFSYIDNQRAQELAELREYANDINDSDCGRALRQPHSLSRRWLLGRNGARCHTSRPKTVLQQEIRHALHRHRNQRL